MSILKIARMGHPTLMRPSAPVEDPTAPEVRALVADMIETLEDVGGVGLAAPQVHVPLRVVIYWVPEMRVRAARYGSEGEESPTDGPQPLTVLINPELSPVGDGLATGIESCLSLPGMSGQVPRHTHLKVRGYNLDGRLTEYEATGFHARVLQHECDHLDGILYPMRMPDLATFGYSEEKAKAADDLDESHSRKEAG